MKYYSKAQWLSVTKAFYRRKKTEDFKRWRRKQFLKQGGLCYYCGEFLPLTRINIDHKRPWSQGGGNNKENLVLCCSACNKLKPREYRDILNRLQMPPTKSVTSEYLARFDCQGFPDCEQ